MFSYPESTDVGAKYDKKTYNYRSQSLKHDPTVPVDMKVNKGLKEGLFMKPTYNTIDDTYQDPYKLGKYNYHNNTNKQPLFVEPWRENGKNGQVFSRFEYIAPEVADKTVKNKKTDKNNENINFEDEETTGNQCHSRQGLVVT